MHVQPDVMPSLAAVHLQTEGGHTLPHYPGSTPVEECRIRTKGHESGLWHGPAKPALVLPSAATHPAGFAGQMLLHSPKTNPVEV